MSKKLFATDSQEEMTQLLESNALFKEKQSVKKIFTKEDLDAFRELFTNKSIVIEGIDEEFAAVKTEFKKKIEPLKIEQKDLLKKIKNGFEFTELLLYAFDDQEAGMMEYYDATGTMVYDRRLMPNEKQTRIHSVKQISKTA